MLILKKNYKPFEIFKSVVFQILSQKNYPKEKWNDAIIALWAFVHGITSLATMENILFGSHILDILSGTMK